MTPFMSDRSESHDTSDFLGGSSMSMSCRAIAGDTDAIKQKSSKINNNNNNDEKNRTYKPE